MPRSEIYGQLAQVETNPKKAIQLIDQARQAAEAEGQSSGIWDVTEMSLRLEMGDFAGADQLIQHIRKEHIREPGIAQALYQVLMEAGILNPDGTPAMTPGRGAAAAPSAVPAAEAGKLWTPDADAAPAPGKKSVIWTPD